MSEFILVMALIMCVGLNKTEKPKVLMPNESFYMDVNGEIGEKKDYCEAECPCPKGEMHILSPESNFTWQELE